MYGHLKICSNLNSTSHQREPRPYVVLERLGPNERRQLDESLNATAAAARDESLKTGDALSPRAVKRGDREKRPTRRHSDSRPLAPQARPTPHDEALHKSTLELGSATVPAAARCPPTSPSSFHSSSAPCPSDACFDALPACTAPQPWDEAGWRCGLGRGVEEGGGEERGRDDAESAEAAAAVGGAEADGLSRLPPLPRLLPPQLRRPEEAPAGQEVCPSPLSLLPLTSGRLSMKVITTFLLRSPEGVS